MAKIQYHYDTETCRYERVKKSKVDMLVNALGILFVCVFSGFIFSVIYTTYFPSPKVSRLTRENKELEAYYEKLSKEIGDAKLMLSSLQDRDDNIYRTIFEAEPISRETSLSRIGSTERYKDILESQDDKSTLVISSLQKMDALKRQVYDQTQEYDELVDITKAKAEMLSALPSIQPIANKDLTRLASGYGIRFHPILKVRRMHKGFDFAAPQGTPVYATGNGTVIKVQNINRGYGKNIEIDHGYGYVTKYAHLSDFEVRKGQKVKRGQIIGAVGATGTTVAPHVHYEVLFDGHNINPIDFFYNDLTPQEYTKLREIASIENQSLGY
ncbi:M23 family metallopeptidase [Flammeovirgaceae bacterium SG7u.111]|nr:M23 family metallopeptidase [Flammeovirgaceae bacterium SG7u.132]WPO33010.1 M23 family metallopeptidase [Flammeovirgaceae bacterium SG7u.111]